MRRSHLEGWEQGTLDSKEDAEMRARMMACDALRNLDFNGLVEFYLTDEQRKQQIKEATNELGTDGS